MAYRCLWTKSSHIWLNIGRVPVFIVLPQFSLRPYSPNLIIVHLFGGIIKIFKYV